MLSLLRCIPTVGSVHLDGIPTHALKLRELRSKITVIPQIVSQSRSVSGQHGIMVFSP